MNEAIISALITGALVLVGVIWSNYAANSRLEQQLEKAQAVTDTKLENLADAVKTHNNFARRMPVVEEQIKVINHRIADLEELQKGDTE